MFESVAPTSGELCFLGVLLMILIAGSTLFIVYVLRIVVNEIKTFIHAENSRMFKALFDNTVLGFDERERKDLYEIQCEMYKFDNISDH